nr:hybrid sensor histidine kinase/response regulator [Cupriavidus gilardii]
MTLLDRSFGVAMLGCALAAWFLAIGLTVSGDRVLALPWAMAISIACAIGHFGRRRMPGRTTEAHACDYACWMTGLMVTIGALWGLMAWLYLDVRSPAVAISVLSLIAGMSAAALAVFAPCLPVAIAFFVPAILPVWARFLATGHADFLPICLGTPLYLGVLIVFARNYAQMARHSIALRFENVDLIEQLREQTARAERAQREAEQASRAKSVFLASASHDLRQPLHALGLFLVSLGRTSLDDRQRQLLSHIDAASAAAREMLNTLLDFSKLEAGVVEPRPRAFRLQPLLHRLENEFAPMAEARGLVYRTRDTTSIAFSDPALVELILRNLIANAIRYTNRGGVLVGCRHRGSHVVIEVWDTGIGIPPSQHQAIFQEFHQLGNPERDQRKGLGLGLAIVDGLARTLCTVVTLSSRPKRGSVFRFSLPYARWPLTAAVEVPRLASPCTGQRFAPLPGVRALIVDDDPHIGLAMCELMSGWHCQCRSAESEDDALDILDAFRPNLIIVDYRLRGGRDGLQAMASIHARMSAEVPAIVITGDTGADRMRHVHASGAVLLHKPVIAEELHEAIVSLLGLDALVRPPGGNKFFG